MRHRLPTLHSNDLIPLILGGAAGAVWLLFFQADIAYADDCLQYVKNVSNFASIPKALLEDCMRTGSVQAIITAIIGALGGGAIAVAVNTALKGPAKTEPQVDARDREIRERKAREREEREREEREHEAREREYRDRQSKDSSFDPSEEEKRKKWAKDGVVWDPRDLGWRLPRPGEGPSGQEQPREREEEKTPRGPTPEGLAEIEAKRKKLEETRKRLDDVPDEERRKWAQGIIDRAAKPNADGTPTGDLDDIDRTIKDFVEREKGNTTWGKIKSGVNEAITFKEDFDKGVAKDLGEIREDVGKVVQKGIDKTADLAVDMVDASSGDKDAQDRIDDRKKVVYDAGEKVVDVVGGVVQKGIDKTADLAVDVKDAISGDKDAERRIDERAKAISDAGKEVWEDTKGVVKDLRDPRIRQEAMDGTFDDLLDPKKVEEAARKVPGIGKLIDATDGKRRATGRLVDGLLGAAELAGTADTVKAVGTIAKGLGGAAVRGGGKLLGGAIRGAENLLDDAARVLGKSADDVVRAGGSVADDATRVIKKSADDVGRGAARISDDAAKAGGARPRAQLDEIDLGEAHPLSPDEMKKALGEIDEGMDAVVKKKPSTKVYPDELPPKAGDVAGRTEEVRESLRKQGVRENLVKRMDYEPVAEFERATLPGKHQTAGHVTPNLTEEATGHVHHPAFEQWDPHKGEWIPQSELAKGRVARHELEHTQQLDRVRTQAGPEGPMRTHYNQQGELTPEGFLYNEREAHLADLDRMLTVRSNALEQARRNPADAEKWLKLAADADKQARHSKASLEVYGASAQRPPTYDPTRVPELGLNAPGPADVTLP